MTRQSSNPFVGLFRVGFRRVHAFQMWSYLGVILALFQLIMIQALWRGVYADSNQNLSVPVGTTMAYLSVIAITNFIVRTTIADDLHRRIDEGSVAIDVVRPVTLPNQLSLIALGDTVGRWVLLVLVVPAVWVVGTLPVPSFSQTLVFIASLALAYVINLLIWMMVGISAFYTIGGAGIRSVIGILSGLLSGAMIPLWFMPDWLRGFTNLLPFRAVGHLPASIVVGEIQGAEVVDALAIQVVWAVVLLLLCRQLWRFVQRRIVIQGG